MSRFAQLHDLDQVSVFETLESHREGYDDDFPSAHYDLVGFGIVVARQVARFEIRHVAYCPYRRHSLFGRLTPNFQGGGGCRCRLGEYLGQISPPLVHATSLPWGAGHWVLWIGKLPPVRGGGEEVGAPWVAANDNSSLS